jgi:hypothetical protein
LFTAFLLNTYYLSAQLSIASTPHDILNNREELVLFTDRNLYAVSEKIFFRSFYCRAGIPQNTPWSRVMYLELVGPAGISVAKGKYYLDESGSSGYIPIPSELITGNYYLRAYTSWMRNFGAHTFSYVPIKIINPYKKEVLPARPEGAEPIVKPLFSEDSSIHYKTQKQVYAPGETVSIDLSGHQYPADFCVTVVPSGAVNHHEIRAAEKEFAPSLRINYLPEIRGVSISGSVLNTVDQQPVSEARLHFALPGKQPGYFTAFTDANGHFLINLPDRLGRQEMFVACEKSPNEKNTIRIEQEFAQDPLPYATPAFFLTPAERNLANQISLNMQISGAYAKQSEPVITMEEEIQGLPFYGKPSNSIHTDKFVQLPSMIEVFENLVPEVLVQYRKGVPPLKMRSQNSNIDMFPPLMLIDNIPILDQSALLAVSTSRINRVEIINEVYVTGNSIFGGIISLSSVKGDMAAIELPEGSYFFDYETFHTGNLRDYTDFFSSRSEPPALFPVPDKRIPDSRNTILWIDRIQPESNENLSIRFTAPQAKGEFTIVLRGLDREGTPVGYSIPFTVE